MSPILPGPICKNLTDLQAALGEVFDREPGEHVA